MPFLRRLRGLIGLSLAWGIAWVPLGLTVYFIERTVNGYTVRWTELPQIAARLGTVGALCGFAFGVVIAITERRRTFGKLSLARIATWGAIGGFAFPIMLISLGARGIGATTTATIFAIYGALGAVTSLGTLAIARRAPALEYGDTEKHLGTPDR